MPRPTMFLRIAPISRRHGNRGFSFVEVLLTLAIVAILSMIAIPAYTSHIAKLRRTQARLQLVQVAQFMQRFYSANDSYRQDRAGNQVSAQLPPMLTQSPAEGAAVYVLRIPDSQLTDAGYVLYMAPVTPGAMAGDRCGTFTLSGAGVRGVIVNGVAASTAVRDSCWN
jgi:type IV pilus assembly protein PilE